MSIVRLKLRKFFSHSAKYKLKGYFQGLKHTFKIKARLEMARAKRHYLPGHVWHLTHRCHKKEFLLKFVRDRRRWLQWLFEAKKRYGISILNYMD